MNWIKNVQKATHTHRIRASSSSALIILICKKGLHFDNSHSISIFYLLGERQKLKRMG